MLARRVRPHPGRQRPITMTRVNLLVVLGRFMAAGPLSRS
jgi:hypothetical protein